MYINPGRQALNECRNEDSFLFVSLPISLCSPNWDDFFSRIGAIPAAGENENSAAAAFSVGPISVYRQTRIRTGSLTPCWFNSRETLLLPDLLIHEWRGIKSSSVLPTSLSGNLSRSYGSFEIQNYFMMICRWRHHRTFKRMQCRPICCTANPLSPVGLTILSLSRCRSAAVG